MNEALQMERRNYLRTKPHERTTARRGHGNGYKSKMVTPALAGGARETFIGEINFDIP